MSDHDYQDILMYNGESEISIPTENAMRIFSGKLSKSQMFHNLYIYSQLEEAGLNIPKIKKVFPVDDERWGVLEDNIKGKTLLYEMNESPDSYDEYLDIIVELQTAVYEVTVRDILPHRKMLESHINSLSLINDEKRAELMEILSALPDGDKTIHGNFGPEYVITDTADTLYVTHWSSVAAGNICADAAMCYLNLSCISTEAAENYLKLFSDKTGCDPDEIRSWIPVMAASKLSVGTASVLQKTFICAWLDIDEEDII